MADPHNLRIEAYAVGAGIIANVEKMSLQTQFISSEPALGRADQSNTRFARKST